MFVSYDVFTAAFLAKITEYKLLKISEENRQELCDGYMKRACAKFAEVCKHDIGNGDDEARGFNLDDITQGELDEIVDIVSDGMVYQWLAQYMYKQENLENMLTTSDYSAYSPAELTYRITNAYKETERKFIGEVREYSYRHADLTVLHL